MHILAHYVSSSEDLTFGKTICMFQNSDILFRSSDILD